MASHSTTGTLSCRSVTWESNVYTLIVFDKDDLNCMQVAWCGEPLVVSAKLEAYLKETNQTEDDVSLCGCTQRR